MKQIVPLTLTLFLTLPASAGIFETTPVWSEPEQLYRQFAYTVASCGDLDDDGYDDVILGAPFYLQGGAQEPGATFIYRGSGDGLIDVPQWPWVGSGFDGLGWEVAGAGDVNDDGHDDVAFAGYANVYVQLGAPSGASFWTFSLGSEGPPSLDAGGDVNGDSLADVVVGVKRGDGERGRVWVFQGTPGGLPAFPDTEIDGELDQGLGEAVRFAGDVNGDGYDDLLACDRGNGFYLYHGSPTGLETQPSWSRAQDSGCFFRLLGDAGDVNGDGFGDVFIGTRELLQDSPGHRYGVQIFLGSAQGLEEEPIQVLFGEEDFRSGMAPLGDVNGDGFDDFALGAHEAAGGGRVWVHLGSEVGLQPSPAWTHEPVPDAGWMGFSVAAAGDVNGDGLLDLLVGDPGALDFVGRAVLYLGAQTLAEGAGGSIDDASMRLTRAHGRIDLAWSTSCTGNAEDYALYRGTLGEFDGYEPVTCSSGGATEWSVADDDGNRFYLVVPRTLNREGSHGHDSLGVERTPPASACLSQQIASCSP